MRITGILLALFLSIQVSAQRLLILEKLGSGKIYTYHVGEPITLRRAADSARFTGTVTMVGDSGFFLDMKVWIRLDDVGTVWRTFPHRRKSGKMVMIGGGVFAGIIIINNLANSNTVIDPVYLAVSAGIATAGLLWRLSSVQKYHIGKSWKLKTLETKFL